MGSFPKPLSASLKNMYLWFPFKHTFKGFSSNVYFLCVIVPFKKKKKIKSLEEKDIYFLKKNMHLIKVFVVIIFTTYNYKLLLLKIS